MSELRIIPVVFGGKHFIITDHRMQYDYGQVLDFKDLELPDSFEARFSNSPVGESVGQIGTNNRIRIPKQFFESGEPIYCYITLHDEVTDGRTVYTTKVPIKPSSERTEEEPEPEEESIITQAISALNTAVEKTAQDVASADALVQAASEQADRAEHAAEGVEGYAERAEAAQSASENAKDRAVEAETSARTSAATASEKASEAISSAATASQSALTAENASESAQASATASAESASQAGQSADTASDKASDASEYASNASTSAQTASQKALEASTSAQTASQAKTDAETAKTASETAQGLAESARDDAITAKEDAESARDEAQEIVDGITGKVEQIDSNTDRIESLEGDRYKPYAVDSASGSIASFPDGADNIPLKSCIVHVEPVQDLHGQDAPYPPGGGTNRFNEDTELGAIGSNGVPYATTDSIRSKTFSACEGSTSYYIGGQVAVYFYDSSETFIEVQYANNNVKTSPANAAYFKLGFYASYGTAYKYDVAVNYPSSVTTYSPYSNICPITGFIKTRIWNDPKYAGNIRWNQIWYNPEDFGANNTQSRVTVTDGVVTATLLKGTPAEYAPAIAPLSTSVSVTTLPSHKYYLACKFKPATDGFPYVRNNTAFPIAAIFGTKITTGGTWGAYENILTATDKGGPAWYLGQGGDIDNIKVGDSISIKDVMCVDLTEMFGSGNEPSTIEEFKALFPADYYPFDDSYAETCVSAVNGDPYQQVEVTFPSEAGTVYGGYVDVLNGELVADRAIIGLGDLTWEYYTSSGHERFVSNAVSPTAKPAPGSTLANALCSSYKLATSNQVYTHSSDSIFCVDGNGKIQVYDSRYSNATAFKTAMSGVQLVYELATPIPYPLTPQEITSLLGQNNIWANTGDTEVEYRADVTKYISKKITEAVSALT